METQKNVEDKIKSIMSSKEKKIGQQQKTETFEANREFQTNESNIDHSS